MGHQLVEKIEVGSGGAASIEFTSIPQDATDLVCVLSLRSGDTNGDEVTGKINGVTTSQSTISLRGSSTSVLSFSSGNYRVANINQNQYGADDDFTTVKIHISNYATSDPKAIRTEYVMGDDIASNIFHGMSSALYDNTTVISSLGFTTNSGQNFLQYSSASLYKIS